MNWRDMSVDQRLAAVRAAYEPGFSAQMIADKIEGASRSAIAAFYYRSRAGELDDCPLRSRANKGGWGGRSDTVRGSEPRRRVKPVDTKTIAAKRAAAKSGEAAKDVALAKVAEEPASRGLRLEDLENGDCRWPTHDNPTLFCGAPQVEGRSYCPHHEGRAWIKVNKHALRNKKPQARVSRTLAAAGAGWGFRKSR